MFDVAFSRRMCCSRVASVRTNPRFPCPVHGLARETAGHLAQVLLLGRDDAAERAAIAERDAERLRFHGDDVGLDGRADNAERDGLGDRHDQQRAFCVRDLGDRRNVFNDAEEVRALDENCCGFFGDGGLQRVKIDAAGFGDRSRSETSASPW